MGAEQAVKERLQTLEKTFSFPRSAMAVQLCTARAGFSQCPEEHAFLAADWPMPRDERSETRFRVYRDLRRKGFYLTPAGKFGGDYLVYPGKISMDGYIFGRFYSPCKVYGVSSYYTVK